MQNWRKNYIAAEQVRKRSPSFKQELLALENVEFPIGKTETPRNATSSKSKYYVGHSHPSSLWESVHTRLDRSQTRLE